MAADEIEVNLLLSKVWRACIGGHVTAEKYALRRAFDELGWGLPEIVVLVMSLTPDDFVRSEPRKYGPGVIWMFRPFRADSGDVWVELILLAHGVLVVSLHLSDGEGEP